MACGGVLLNRLVLTIQTLALPTLAFDDFLHYVPSWQEVATFGGLIAIQNLLTKTPLPQIISVSYGECEAENGAAANAARYGPSWSVAA